MTNNDNSTPQQKILQLQQIFYTQLPEKLAAIQQVWRKINSEFVESRDFHELYRLLHNLVGGAGTFGAESISNAARGLEEIFRKFSDCNTVEACKALLKAHLSIIENNFIHLQHAISDWKPGDTTQRLPDVRPINNLKSELVVLVEDDQLLAGELIKCLKEVSYRVLYFNSISTFERANLDEIPAALIMDMVFAEGGLAGANVLQNLEQRSMQQLPIIFISVRKDIQARLAAAKVGATRYFTKPLDVKRLISSLDEITQRVKVQSFRVLYIDDDEIELAYYSTFLREAGFIVETLNDPLKGMDVINDFEPDLIILDVYMNGCSGTELAQVIRHDENYNHIPIVFLSVESDLSRRITAMDLGGDDYLIKPVDIQYLVKKISAKIRRARWIRDLNRDLEAALREKDNQQFALNQHAIVSESDVEGNITYANEKFCAISGYTKEELLGQNHRILKSGHHSKGFYKSIWETISSGKVWHGSICNRKKNGEEYWVESTIVPFLDENRLPYKYISVRTDITASRANEERLDRSQVFANIGTWDWNIKTGELYWSQRIGPLFGYNTEMPETTYENFLAAVHPDDRASVTNAVDRCVKYGEEYNIEHRVVWPNGSVHWMLERGDVIRSPKGEPLHMLGVVQDITLRKELESKLIKHHAAMERTLDGVAIVNGAGEFIYVNPAFAEIYGISSVDQLLGCSWREFYDALSLQIIDSEVKEALESLEHWSGELTGIRNQTQQFPQSVSLATLANSEMVCIIRDISANKLTERELINARIEAENANKAKSQFLSSMSHELRTPLNAIIGFSQLLKMETSEMNESQLDNVNEILKAGNHLLELINEVLDLAKVESGRIDLSLGSVNLGEIVVESLSLISPLAKKRNIQIEVLKNNKVLSAEGLLTESDAIRADRTRLKQVLLNLLSNAVKYNFEHGRIVLHCETLDEDTIRLSVTDTGQGIDESNLTDLFKPFERLGAESTHIEGTGIGLVITKKIIELMGGEIGVSSKLNHGSTFWITLPRVQSNKRVKKVGGDEYITGEKDVPIDSNKFRILYIEDNPANLRLITQTLSKRANIEILSAHQPMLGLELAQQQIPDLILLDINLPGMKGTSVLKHLRTHEKTKHIPVVALSANAMHSDVERGLAAGFDNYLTKPFDLQLLLQLVDSFMLNR